MHMDNLLIYKFLVLLMTHWFADFVLQTHWQASNKSKNNAALTTHVITYTAVMTFVSLYLFYPENVMPFIGANAVLHFCTDWCTSRLSSRLYAKQDWHNFFVVIGFDQLIHQVTLAGTMLWLL